MELALQGIGLTLAGIEQEQLPEAVKNRCAKQPENTEADTSELNTFFNPRRLRRVDHFTRMTMLAACRSLHDAAGRSNETAAPELPEDTGIIISTGYGPSRTIFEFLDSIIDFGPTCASPLSFSHSVHNIPAATLSMFMGRNCAYTTICQTHGPLSAALLTAGSWISEGRVGRVLLGTVDERTPLLDENTERLLAEKGHTRSILPLTEGACFFLLGRKQEGTDKGYGSIEFSRHSPEKLKTHTGKHLCLAPSRSLPALDRLGISAGSAMAADMPVAAGVELAAAALSVPKQGCCVIEQTGRDFGLIRLRTDR